MEVGVEQARGGKGRSADVCAVLPFRLTGLNTQMARASFSLKSVLLEVCMLTLGGKACPLDPKGRPEVIPVESKVLQLFHTPARHSTGA